MKSKPLINAVLSIGIADSPLKGVIYILEHNDQKAAICECRGSHSEIYYADEEPVVYHQCRDWFMDNYDGFVQVRKLEGEEENQAIDDFEELKNLF